jgi:hypothetical protein
MTRKIKENGRKRERNHPKIGTRENQRRYIQNNILFVVQVV